MTDANETYNGWTNYETWQCALWLGDDEYLYSLAQRATDEDELKDLVETHLSGDSSASLMLLPPSADLSRPLADLVGAWVERVDFREIFERQIVWGIEDATDDIEVLPTEDLSKSSRRASLRLSEELARLGQARRNCHASVIATADVLGGK